MLHQAETLESAVHCSVCMTCLQNLAGATKSLDAHQLGTLVCPDLYSMACTLYLVRCSSQE